MMRRRTIQVALLIGVASLAAGVLAAPIQDGAQGSSAGRINTILDRWQVVEADKGGDVALWRDMMSIQLKQVAPATLDKLLAVSTGSNSQSAGQLYQTFIYTLGTDIALRLQAQRAGQITAQAQQVLPAASPAVGSPSGRSIQSGTVGPTSLGSTGIDQTFTPITPCRVVDTRNVGGPIAAFATRNFFFYTVIGSFSWATQGGVNGAAGTVCPGTLINGFTPSAAIATVTVTGQAGNGNLIVWQGTNPVASASTMSYPASGDTSSLAAIPEGGRSGTGPGGSVLDFGVFVNAFTATNVVVDIVGYYSEPAATALQCTTPFNATSNTSVANGAVFGVSAPGCPSGYTRTGSGCYSSLPPGVFLLEAGTSTFGDCWWQNVSGATINPSALSFGADSYCCRVPGH